jgi:dihydrofolate reductase
MAKLVFAMNQSLDGFVDHDHFALNPTPGLFRHFIVQTAALSASIYGRVMYDLMRYWDSDQPEWKEAEHDYAAAWRRQHKWVVSRTLTSVGPNATLVGGDPVGLARRLKSEADGEIFAGGPNLAGQLSEARLIDEFHIYLHPAVTGGGKPFFLGTRPKLRLAGTEPLDGGVIRLAYAPA